jgi:hypothetical protein
LSAEGIAGYGEQIKSLEKGISEELDKEPEKIK